MFSTFPDKMNTCTLWPYMNGCLHLGHTFSLYKCKVYNNLFDDLTNLYTVIMSFATPALANDIYDKM